MSLSQHGLTRVVATFFGIGYLPVIPGTLTSLVAVFLAWFLYPGLPYWCLGLTLAGFWACLDARAALGGEDPPSFVMDEVCGMFLSLLWLPRTVWVFGAAFLLFRFFDVVKPWPISVIQKSKGSWSIMGDDLLAGVFANLVLRLVWPLIPAQ